MINIKYWDSTPVSTNNFSFATKDFDFGYPAVRKKIYRLYVSGQGTNAPIVAKYRINGSDSTWTVFGSFQFTNGVAIITPPASINNVYSIQLKFEGVVDSGFYINDISIVFRPKRVR